MNFSSLDLFPRGFALHHAGPVVAALAVSCAAAGSIIAQEIPLFTRGGGDGRGPFNAMREVVYKTVGTLPLRIWIMTPPGWTAADKRPLIIYSYGSGWKGNSQPADIMELKYYNRIWTKGLRFCHDFGAVTVGFDYRGGKSGGIPDQIGDAKSATRWALAHAAELGIDPKRLILAGDSSGGHLAASAGMFPGQFDDPADGRPTPIKAGAILSFCSVLSRDEATLSPAQQLRADSAPTLLMFGDQDGWKKTADVYAAAAEKVGVPVHFEVYPGANHDFHVGGAYFDQTMVLAGRFMQACDLVPWQGVCLPGTTLELRGFGDVMAMAVRTPLKGKPGVVTYSATAGGRIDGNMFVSDGSTGVFPVVGTDTAFGPASRRRGWIRVPVVLDTDQPEVSVIADGPWTDNANSKAIGGKEWQLPNGTPGSLTLKWTAKSPGKYLVYGVTTASAKGADSVTISATVGTSPVFEGRWEPLSARVAGGYLLLPQAIDLKPDESFAIRIGRSSNLNRVLALDAVLLVPITQGHLP